MMIGNFIDRNSLERAIKKKAQCYFTGSGKATTGSIIMKSKRE